MDFSSCRYKFIFSIDAPIDAIYLAPVGAIQITILLHVVKKYT